MDFEKLELAFRQYVNKRENPCDTCALADACAQDDTDCFAFRRWSNEGDYRDRQVARLVRPFELWD